jgi:hypothetical protein
MVPVHDRIPMRARVVIYGPILGLPALENTDGSVALYLTFPIPASDETLTQHDDRHRLNQDWADKAMAIYHRANPTLTRVK